MPFSATVTNQNDCSIYWEFSLKLCGTPFTLAKSAAVATGKITSALPPVWRRFFRAEQGVVFDLDELDHYQTLVASIVETLEELAANASRKERVALYQMFLDGNLETGGARRMINELQSNRMVDGAAADGAGRISGEDLAAIAMILFKAIFRFLRRGERYAAQEARLACLYAAWQWYNLAKLLSMLVYQDYQDYLKQADETGTSHGDKNSHPYLALVQEMAEGHQELSQMLENPPEFDHAIHWLAYWAEVSGGSSSLLREQMRVSLPLIPVAWQSGFATTPDFDWKIPLHAPGWEPARTQPNHWYSSTARKLGLYPTPAPEWRKTILHSVFEVRDGNETAGRRSIRKLIGDWLLSRYDFDNSGQFARLLRSNLPQKPRSPLLPVVLAFVFVFIFFIPLLASRIAQVVGLAPDVLLRGGVIAEWAIIILFGLKATRDFDHSVLPYMILPRLAGGVMVGYFVLILSEDSFRLHKYFFPCNSCFWSVVLPLLLWATVLGIGFAYLYYDVLPFAGSRRRKIAVIRACQALMIALALSAFLGLFLLAIASQMYVGDRIQEAGLVLLGPLGLIDWQTYFLFVPIALFTGLVTQFIFEEKTVTTSIWLPEVE